MLLLSAKTYSNATLNLVPFFPPAAGSASSGPHTMPHQRPFQSRTGSHFSSPDLQSKLKGRCKSPRASTVPVPGVSFALSEVYKVIKRNEHILTPSGSIRASNISQNISKNFVEFCTCWKRIWPRHRSASASVPRLRPKNGPRPPHRATCPGPGIKTYPKCPNPKTWT